MSVTAFFDDEQFTRHTELRRAGRVSFPVCDSDLRHALRITVSALVLTPRVVPAG